MASKEQYEQLYRDYFVFAVVRTSALGCAPTFAASTTVVPIPSPVVCLIPQRPCSAPCKRASPAASCCLWLAPPFPPPPAGAQPVDAGGVVVPHAAAVHAPHLRLPGRQLEQHVPGPQPAGPPAQHPPTRVHPRKVGGAGVCVWCVGGVGQWRGAGDAISSDSGGSELRVRCHARIWVRSGGRAAAPAPGWPLPLPLPTVPPPLPASPPPPPPPLPAGSRARALPCTT